MLQVGSYTTTVQGSRVTACVRRRMLVYGGEFGPWRYTAGRLVEYFDIPS